MKRILADYEAGKVDILVGTHRVLSRDVKAKDLWQKVVRMTRPDSQQHKRAKGNLAKYE